MTDYAQKLRDDLVEQFKGKPVIDALMEVIGEELNEVWRFYDDLREKRSIHTAVGKQLDGIGENAVLTRAEAGALACFNKPVYILDDSSYRAYLIYKIWKNTTNCTYSSIIKSIAMFWDSPLHYREEPDIPATMIFDTGELDGNVDTTPLFDVPLIRPAGVAIELYARTKTEIAPTSLHVFSGLGYAVTETSLPEIERKVNYAATLHVNGGVAHSIVETVLPPLRSKTLYYCDDFTDLQNIKDPPVGSIASIVHEGGKAYMADSSGIWHEA